jgi:hypothetical protein
MWKAIQRNNDFQAWLLDRSEICLKRITATDKQEDDMENLVGIGQFWGGAFGFFGGLGVFFIGIGFLWFVTIYRDIHKKE